MRSFLLFLLFLPVVLFAQNGEWHTVDTKVTASFRGLSVVDDSVAWVSGSKGWLGISLNGGVGWKFTQVKGYEQCDFRSIYAVDGKTAIIANAGAPAYILRTEDGGATWQKLYENTDTTAFIDGIAMYGNNGTVYGDPINGRMLLIRTTDGGLTWTESDVENRPLLTEGEASFAASGTCIQYIDRKKVLIATGGKVSRLLISRDGGKNWRYITTPILQGESGTGIFSVVALGRRHWVIAGGNYKNDTLRKDALFYTRNAGKRWYAPMTGTTRGYRECLISLGDRILIATGPSGIDISYNNGGFWHPFSNERQFHVARRARNGHLIILAGGNGRLCRLRMYPKSSWL